MGTYSGKMGKGGSKKAAAAKAAEAVADAEKRAKLTNKQKLVLLDQRLGVGIGAKKERERLSRPPKAAVAKAEANAVTPPPKLSADEKKHRQNEKRAARALAKNQPDVNID